VSRNKLDKVSDYHLMNALGSLFRIKPDGVSDAPSMVELIHNSEADHMLPFNLSEVRLVWEKMQVVGEVLFTKKRSPILNYLDETPDTTLIITDPMLSGKDALYAVRLGTPDTVSRWINCMNKHNLLVGGIDDFFIVAAPLKSFV
jgi:hypothetical protein